MDIFRNKTVTIIGLGALGSVISTQLANLGIGHLRLIDRDIVEISNLQRQMLFDEQDAAQGIPKVVAASEKLRKRNLRTNISSFVEDVNPFSIIKLVQGSDVIVDGTDNLETRFLINDISVKERIPWVYGGAIHSRGMSATFIPDETLCFRCLFDQPLAFHGQTCDTVGVIGPLVNIIASYQVLSVIQILRNEFKAHDAVLRQIDLWYNDHDLLPLQNGINPECPCCRKHRFEFLNQSITGPMITQLCGRDSLQMTPTTSLEIDFQQWSERWSHFGKVEQTPFCLRLQYGGYQVVLFQGGRLLIQGTNDEQEGRQLYTQLVGL